MIEVENLRNLQILANGRNPLERSIAYGRCTQKANQQVGDNGFFERTPIRNTANITMGQVLGQQHIHYYEDSTNPLKHSQDDYFNELASELEM